MPRHSHKKKCSRKCYKLSSSRSKCKKGSRRHRKNSRKCCVIVKPTSPCHRCPVGYHRSRLTGACEAYIRIAQTKEGQLAQIQQKKEELIDSKIQVEEKKEMLEDKKELIDDKKEKIESLIVEIKDNLEEGQSSKSLVLLEKQLSQLDQQDKIISEEIKNLEKVEEQQLSQIETLQVQERKIDEEMKDNETREKERILIEEVKQREEEIRLQQEQAKMIADQNIKRQIEEQLLEEKESLIREEKEQINEIREERKQEEKIVQQEIKDVLDELNSLKKLNFFEIARRNGIDISGPPYTISSIERAYRRIARLHHPDKCSPAQKEYCGEYFKALLNKKNEEIVKIKKEKGWK